MIVRCFLALIGLLLAPLTTHCAENRYDVLGKVLMPFVQLLAKQTTNPNRALKLALRIESITSLPPDWTGAHAEIAVQYPDKLRLFGPVLGEELTICRNGQELWVYPGNKIEALLGEATADKTLPPLDKKFRLAPFRLPVPEKQLVFAPVLFQVTESASESVSGQPCRVLDLKLMPELARALDATEWSARLWVRSDYRPARLIVARPGWQATVLIEQVQFSPSLPEETWQPGPEQGDDVLKISPARYQQLLKVIGGKRTK